MDWYEADVQNAEREKSKLLYDPEMVFYGSSSIRLWGDRLYEDFKGYLPVNLGFGGSTLAACNWFFERLLTPYHPVHIVLYAGDNDLGDGIQPAEVFESFKKFVQLMDKHFPAVGFSFISIKPSIARWDIIDNIRAVNTMIKAYIEDGYEKHFYVNIFDSMLNNEGKPVAALFDTDGLHLSSNGYDVWRDVLLEHFKNNLKDSIT